MDIPRLASAARTRETERERERETEREREREREIKNMLIRPNGMLTAANSTHQLSQHQREDNCPNPLIPFAVNVTMRYASVEIKGDRDVYVPSPLRCESANLASATTIERCLWGEEGDGFSHGGQPTSRTHNLGGSSRTRAHGVRVDRRPAAAGRNGVDPPLDYNRVA